MDKKIVSMTNKIWIIKSPDKVYPGYPEILSRLLINRNIQLSDVEDFISPTLKKLMPDPYVLKDMEKSVQKIASCIKLKEKIVIIGDYDVDGVTSTSLLVNYFKAIHFNNFEYYIPHRLNDGYGINKQIIERFSNVKTIITLDNGSTADEALELAKNFGIDVVVLDHHKMDDINPNAFAIVNAHRPDDQSNLKNMCAVGITFFFIIALNRYFRLTKFFEVNGLAEPNLIDYIDMVAVGTVCDVMPLTGLNRAIVKIGLQKILSTKNVGLKNILNISKFTKEITSESFAFFLGPRLNAAGRIDDATTSVKLLTSDSDILAKKLAEKINTLNEERQAIENITLSEIPCVLNTEYFALAHGNNWHVGIIGIIAGKLKERYNVPSFVISFDKDGIGHGSARSIEEYDLSHIISKAKEMGILIGGGGHKLAGGFSIKIEKLSEFKKFLEGEIKGPRVLPKITADGYIALSGITIKFIEEINKLEPFGQENEKPKFVINNVKIAYFSVIGKSQRHISLKLEDEFGYKMKGLAFNCVDTPLGQILCDIKSKNKLFDILGSFSVNQWNNKTEINILVEDIAETA